MIKKVLTMSLLTLTFLIVGATTTCAYQLEDDYKPINEPFSNIVDNVDGVTSADIAGNQAIAILQIIAGALLYVAAPLTVVIIGLAAFNMVMGGDDTEKIDTVKKQLTWAIVGLILIILSYTTVRAVIRLAVDVGTPTEESTLLYAQTEDPHSLQHYLV